MTDFTLDPDQAVYLTGRNVRIISVLFFGLGAGAFAYQLATGHEEAAWQSYLVNFLLWSGMAQGGLLFSAVMRLTQAKWPGSLSGLAESFAAFFPLSFVIFVCLFAGKAHVFPWQSLDLQGKEVWLNIPFLFVRDGIGLLILYGLGFLYLYDAMKLRIMSRQGAIENIDPGEKDHLDEKSWSGRIHGFLISRILNHSPDQLKIQKRLTQTAALYIAAFAVILSLLGYDLVMSADPHWVSTLFGAYTFVKAFYVGLGGLIILAWFYQGQLKNGSGLTASQFHDVGKLFFAFCLLWADFFYVQFLVIWYGNLPEETSYVITRTMMPPWNLLAWIVFIVCFVVPFFILLNKKVKTKPGVMMVICSLVIMGIWFEHHLLLGPALNQQATAIPLGVTDGLIFLGFLGLMVFSVTRFLDFLPELLLPIIPLENDIEEKG